MSSNDIGKNNHYQGDRRPLYNADDDASAAVFGKERIVGRFFEWLAKHSGYDQIGEDRYEDNQNEYEIFSEFFRHLYSSQIIYSGFIAISPL